MEDAQRFLDADHNAWPVMDGGHLAGMITLAQVEQEIAAGHGNRALGELLPADVPSPFLNAENFSASAHGSSAGHGDAAHGAHQVERAAGGGARRIFAI